MDECADMLGMNLFIAEEICSMPCNAYDSILEKVGKFSTCIKLT